MKRIGTFFIVSCIIILLATSLFGQPQTKPIQESAKVPLPLIRVIDREGSSMVTRWEYGIVYGGKPDGMPKSSAEALEDLSKWLEKTKRINERNLVLKYERNIKEIFDELKFIGNEPSSFICNDVSEPTWFAQKEDEIVFLLTGVTSTNVYNTLRTTYKTRASKILNSIILPSMKAFHTSFKNTDIGYYGLLVAYGSKDFSNDKTISNLRAEVLAFIVSKENCKKFTERTITDDDLVTTSEIYLRDRDTKDFKRVKLTLE